MQGELKSIKIDGLAKSPNRCAFNLIPNEMNTPSLYAVLADSVLALHVAYVLFVVLGLLLILAGGLWGWRWVRIRRLRLAHLLAIGVVVLQLWLGLVCPLTTLEMALRVRAEDAVYAGSFIGYCLQALLYFEAPTWVFGVVYTLFALLVFLSWFWVRPKPAR